MDRVSNKQSEHGLIPLSMDVTLPVIIERGSGSECPCIDQVYREPDPDCSKCFGVGTVVNRSRTLVEASMQPSGEIYDDGDPIIYACTFHQGIQVDDIIICKGKRYVVIEISSGETTKGKDVLICGLDYERNYNHSETVLSRYK